MTVTVYLPRGRAVSLNDKKGDCSMKTMFKTLAKHFAQYGEFTTVTNFGL